MMKLFNLQKSHKKRLTKYLKVCFGSKLLQSIFFLPHLSHFVELSHEVVSAIDITPCNKIDKLLVIYRFSNVG